MIDPINTRWKIFAGEYGPENLFQIVPTPEAPIMWRGDEPPTNKADAHIYAVWRTDDRIELRLLKIKEKLYFMGIPVGHSEVVILFPGTADHDLLAAAMDKRAIQAAIQSRK